MSVLHQEPSRLVKSRRGNLTGTIASAKQGHSIDFESYGVERHFVWQCEFDPEITISSQPKTPVIGLPDKNGKVRYMERTCDFRVVEPNEREVFVECKRYDEFLKLAKGNPHRYEVDAQGSPRSPIMEAELAKHDIGFRIVTERDLDPVLAVNYEYIHGARVKVEAASEIHKRIQEYVAADIRNLKEMVCELNCDIPTVLEAMQLEMVYIDLRQGYLANPASIFVCRDRLISEAYKSIGKIDTPSFGSATCMVGDVIDFEGARFEVTMIGRDNILTCALDGTNATRRFGRNELVQLVADGTFVVINTSSKKQVQSDARELIHKASGPALESAVRKVKIANGEISDPDVSLRTLQRYRKTASESMRLYGVAFLLFLKRSEQGNRVSRITQEASELIKECIDEYYLNRQRRSVSGVYGIYREKCKEKKLQCVSRVTFGNIIKKTNTRFQRESKRGTHRASFPFSRWVGEKSNQTNFAQHTFQRAHIDSKLIDQEMTCYFSGMAIGQPWMTVVLSESSRYPLGWYVSFDPPSAATAMAALEDVYKRHGRLPDEIVMDNGKEFKNHAIRGLLSAFGTNITYRPPRSPRHGPIIERFFGVFDKRLSHHLKGATHGLGRQSGLSKANFAKGEACWDLRSLVDAIDGFMEVYKKTEHVSLGVSPQELYEQDIRNHGSLQRVSLPYETCRMLFLPDTKRNLTIQAGRGVCYEYHWYSCDQMYESDLEGVSVRAKYDPSDLSVIYLSVRGEWIQANLISGPMREAAKKLSAKEMRYVLAQVKQRTKLMHSSKKKNEIMHEFARYLTEVQGKEKSLAERKRANENRRAREAEEDSDPVKVEGVSVPVVLEEEIHPQENFRPTFNVADIQTSNIGEF